MVGSPKSIDKYKEGIDISPLVKGETMDRGSIYWWKSE